MIFICDEAIQNASDGFTSSFLDELFVGSLQLVCVMLAL